MTLRLRLVLALAVLATAGLAAFGVTTYSLYSHSQYQRLDDQLRSAVPMVSVQLRRTAVGDNAALGGTSPLPGAAGANPNSGTPTPGRPPEAGLIGAYGELRSATGTVLARTPLASSSDARPKLPATLHPGRRGHFFSVGSTTSSDRWRVLAMTEARFGGSGDIVVVAAPLTSVTDSLNRFVLIEAATGVGLLLVLAAGSWLILRRGLRPLEHMATTARSISSGDLDQRVAPDDPRTEIGQLGQAVNVMLGRLQTSFAEQEATEHRLRQFLADASHELRTPLTSIQGFAELFRLGVADKDHVNLDVISRRIEQESARMKKLVEDLLLLARIDETRDAEQAPVNLSVLAADACSDAVAADPSRPITLDAPAPVVTLGDEDHLRQAITNLVTNALRHTPEGTPIDVRTRVDDNEAEVQVRDHGLGLDDEAVVHVFDRFWQADSARVGVGAGLGLAIVASIAAEHGGEATAANVPDGGASFTLRLPLHPDSRRVHDDVARS